MGEALSNTQIGLNSRVRYRAVDGDGVMLQMDSNRVLVLNEVGLRVVELLATPKSIDALTDTIVSEFEAAREQVQADLEQFLTQLHGEQVLSGFRPPEGL